MVHIRLKGIMDENFQDYKKTSMMLITCICDWKCLVEKGLDISICQNSTLASQKTIDVPIDVIIDRYLSNTITSAIVIGGLEPFLQFDEIIDFVQQLRVKSTDDIVIYTGYYGEEIQEYIGLLQEYSNITIKFGRFKPNSGERYDEILGISLASDNQYAVEIS